MYRTYICTSTYVCCPSFCPYLTAHAHSKSADGRSLRKYSPCLCSPLSKDLLAHFTYDMWGSRDLFLLSYHLIASQMVTMRQKLWGDDEHCSMTTVVNGWRSSERGAHTATVSGSPQRISGRNSGQQPPCDRPFLFLAMGRLYKECKVSLIYHQ